MTDLVNRALGSGRAMLLPADVRDVIEGMAALIEDLAITVQRHENHLTHYGE